MIGLVKRMPRYVLLIGTVLVAILLGYTAVYVINKPGGFADWRLSQAMGLTETVRIPLGSTSDEAVERFRGTSNLETLLREPVHGGVLQFGKQRTGQEGTNLQVNIVRKAWLGWKWAAGGGYGYVGSRSDVTEKSEFAYMMLPANKGSSLGVPLLFGEILDAAITNIVVRSEAEESETKEYKVKIVKTDTDSIVWYLVLPASVSIPFEIVAYTDQGEIRATQMVTDERENGLVGQQGG